MAELIREGRGADLQARIEALKAMLEDHEPRVRGFAINAALASEDESVRQLSEPYAERFLHEENDPMILGSIAEALSSEAADVTPRLRLALAWRLQNHPPVDPELHMSLLDALRTVAPELAHKHVVAALNDANAAVRSFARRILRETYDVEAKIQPHPAKSPRRGDLQRALEKSRDDILQVTTTRGNFTLRLFAKAAPWNVGNLLNLADAGFYDDTLWHRVVPDFVVQGGDPTGTGWGGPGYSVVAEASAAKYKRGTVGIADAGKDTGGSQWFITHTRTPHLEGRYTVIGRVESGMDVVDRLLVGDRILKARAVRKKDSASQL
ncbi:MAG: peptidylprolyl isomerase [Myxococcota bacterium]